jgi:hypothetical protein
MVSEYLNDPESETTWERSTCETCGVALWPSTVLMNQVHC